MNTDTKLCLTGCFRRLPVSDFGRHPRSPDGLASRCKSCERDRLQIRKHGITARQKAELADAQGGCAICRRPEPGAKGWVVDHDHACCPGEVSCEKCRRGIVCQWCNNVLGYAHDRADVLRAAADYLESGNRLASQSTDSVDRPGRPAPTDVRDVRTDVDPGHLRDNTSPYVTRTRAYKIFHGLEQSR